MDPLVSTDWLSKHLGEPGLVIVDASLHMPSSGRDGRDEFLRAHIPGARFFDIEALSDRSNPAPHMLPSAEAFAAAMERIGVSSDDGIVVYDNSPLRSAARGWFMLRHFGALKVAVLDGGFQKWNSETRPTESGEPDPRNASFDAAGRRDEIVTKAQLCDRLPLPVVDARGAARFDGSEADPRPGVAAGHIPGSRNLPYAALYNADGTFKSRSEVERIFDEAGADQKRPFVATCGSGITANSLIFAAYLGGNRDARLYDGSWSEWGSDPDTPKAVGTG